MGKNFRFFLIIFLLSLPFWWGVNILEENLENFFYWQEMTALTSQLVFEQRIRVVSDLEIEAKSALSISLDNQGKKRTLFEKNADCRLPIASLSKLMTAWIVLKNYDLNQVVEISQKAAQISESEETKLKEGEKFYLEDLLYSMLIESNNISSFALAEIIGEENFVELMNLEAENLGLKNTHFVNSTGLDQSNSANYSTAQDLIKFSENLLSEHLISEILSIPKFDLYSAEGVFHHQVVNTNQLLGEISSMVWGKTGETPQAGGCLLIITKAPQGKGYLINVLLNSGNRFEEIKKLIK